MRPAVWLMDRFGVSEILVGDLVEERSRKHSTLWLWRQVLVAIAGTVAGDIRAHKWLAIRAVVLGWGVGQFVAPFRRILIPLMSGRWVWLSEGWLDNALGFPVMPLPFMIVMSAGAVITGLVVARLHRGHEMSMVCRFSEGRDPSFSKPFPPDLFPRLSALSVPYSRRSCLLLVVMGRSGRLFLKLVIEEPAGARRP